MQGRYSRGSLVNVRGRDLGVLPPEQPEVLSLRALTGANDAEVGIFLPLEKQAVTPSPEVKGVFADWITRPENRTTENYSAFEPVFMGLRAIL